MKVQNPLTGRSSGKYGTGRFSTWNGKNIVATQPASYNDKKTDVQISNRAMMTALSRKAAALNTVGQFVFQSRPMGMTYYNSITAALQMGVDRSVTPAVWSPENTDFGISSEKNVLPSTITLSGLAVTVNYTANTMTDSEKAAKKVTIIALNETQLFAEKIVSSATISAQSGSAVLNLSAANRDDDVISIWVCAVNNADEQISSIAYAYPDQFTLNIV